MTRKVVIDGVLVEVDETAASDADLGAQTVVAATTDTSAAQLVSTQAAVDALIADLNDLKAKLRTAGLLAA